MYDTINFKIYSSPTYNQKLYNAIHIVKSDERKIYKSPKIGNLMLSRFDDKMMASLNGQIVAPSSHHEILWNYSTKTHFLSFQFSLTKFFYSTNVFMLNKRTAKNVDFFKNYDYWDSLLYANDLLKQAINEIIDYFIPSENVKNDIIIERADFCYNAIFDTLENRDLYFNSLYRFHKPRYSGKNIMGYKEQSLMWSTKGHSSKVYKKDKEFKKNDLNKLIQNCGYGLTEAKQILKLSEHMLRFEITFRNKEMSYLFRKNEKIYTINKKKIKDSVQEYETTFFESDKKILLKREYDKYLGKSLNFYLYPATKNELSIIENNNYKFYVIPSTTASFVELSYILRKKFYDFVLQMRLKKVYTKSYYEEKLKEYKKIKKSFNLKSYINLINLMKVKTLNELVQNDVISRQTKSNMLKKFVELGINLPENQTIETFDLTFTMNLEKYYSLLYKYNLNN